jgi:allantoate deiminase
LLDRRDADGVSVRDAVSAFGGDPDRLTIGELGSRRLLGWIEAHIEQGPILDAEDLAVGVVTDIAGQTRATISVVGEAGHAGTVPMELRKDALMGAAELALAVERIARSMTGLVATIGQATVQPGASNVIPARVVMTLDVRHPFDDERERALNEIYASAGEISGRRKVGIAISERTDTPANACDERLTASLERAIAETGRPVRRIVSGAGHDAVALSARMPVTMLFVRCKNGISHNPAESIDERDAAAALDVLDRFLMLLAQP